MSQLRNAQRVEALRIGIHVAQTNDEQSLRAAIQTAMTDPSYAKQAARARQSLLDLPSPEAVLSRLATQFAVTIAAGTHDVCHIANSASTSAQEADQSQTVGRSAGCTTAVTLTPRFTGALRSSDKVTHGVVARAPSASRHVGQLLELAR